MKRIARAFRLIETRDGAADGTNFSGLSQPRDAESMALLRAVARTAWKIHRDC
jgi:hypothetical protein